LTGKSYIEAAHGYLDMLVELYSCIEKIEIVLDKSCRREQISDKFDDFFGQIARGLSELAFDNVESADKAFRLSSTAKLYFSNTFVLTGSNGVGEIWINLAIGRSDDGLDIVSLRFPPHVHSEMLKALFQKSVIYWKPVNGCVNRERLFSSLRQPLGEVRIGWLTYLANIAVSDLNVSGAEVTELQQGGLLQLPPDILGANDIVALERLTSLRLELLNKGALGKLPGSERKSRRRRKTVS
jgi:hypothetical protein